MALQVPVSANTRPMEKQILAALNKNYKVNLQTRGFSQPLGKITGQVGEFEKSLEASNARVIAFGASAGAIVAVQQALKGTVTAAINVEKKLADINVILNTSAASLAKFGDQLFKIAGQTGQSFDAVADAAAEFARQGLGLEKTLLRTRDALILTRLSGLDVVSSVNSLTAAINSFSKAALNSTEIVNKLANVDAAFAVSSGDLANAIARVGSTAEDAGVSFDELIAIVTTAQQTTARGGAVIGNSFKTIFTRIQRPKTLQELEKLGITVRDLQGEVKPAIQILGDLARTFDGLGSSQRSQIAELVGGVFQINVLKAALSDLNKEYSIYGSALETSLGSTDEAVKRNEQLNKTLSALVNETFVNLTNVASKFGQGAFGPAIRNVLETVNSAIKPEDAEEGGSNIARGILSGIGKFISGPGLVIAGTALTKIFINLTRFAADAFKAIQNLNIQSAEQRKVQQSIGQLLSEQPQLLQAVLKGTVSTEGAAKLVLQQYQAQQKVLQENARLVKIISSAAVGKNISTKTTAGGSLPRYADGSIEDLEKRGARRGGYISGEVIPSPIGGVMNTAETIAYDNRFSQPFINPPEGSNAGRSHKRKSIDRLGVDPYALPQIGFAAGGATPEGYNYPFRVLQRGKPRPVNPKDVVKRSREYELQLLNGGLAKLGFSDVKDLNAVFGSNSEADFFATKSGRPYLVDAKAGYNDAKESQMLKKQGTISSLRQTAKYKTYLESLGYNDADVRTAIVFGNAQIQQQKTLRKKGILRNASGNSPNYNGGSTPSAKSKAKKAEGFKKGIRGLAGKVIKKSKLYEEKDVPSILAGRIFEAKTQSPNTQFLDLVENIKEADIQKGTHRVSEAKLSVQAALRDKSLGGSGGKGRNLIVPKTAKITDRQKTNLEKRGIDGVVESEDLEGRIKHPSLTHNYLFGLARKTIAGYKNTPNVDMRKVKIGGPPKTKGTRRRAKGSIPNFAKGSKPKPNKDSGEGGGNFGAALGISFILPQVAGALQELVGSTTTAGKNIGIAGEAANSASSAFFLTDAIVGVLPKKFKPLGTALKYLFTAVAGATSIFSGYKKSFSDSAKLQEILNKRLEEANQTQQKLNDTSQGYLTALQNYQQSLAESKDPRVINKRFEELENALSQLPEKYKALVVSAPNLDKAQEILAKGLKDATRQKGIEQVLSENIGEDGINFDEFVKRLVEKSNPDKMFTAAAGGGVDISSQLQEALKAGGSIDGLGRALGLTAEQADLLRQKLDVNNKSSAEVAASVTQEVLAKKKNLNTTKLSTALIKERVKIETKYSKTVQQTTKRMEDSLANIDNLASSLKDGRERRKVTRDLERDTAALVSGRVTDPQDQAELAARIVEANKKLGLATDTDVLKKFISPAISNLVKQQATLGSLAFTKRDPSLEKAGSVVTNTFLGIENDGEDKKFKEFREEIFGVTKATEDEKEAKEKLVIAIEKVREKFKDLPDQINAAVAALRGTAGVASGFIPNFATAAGERIAAKAGGYTAGAIKHVNVPGVGRVMANSAETVKQFPGMSQPAIMPPSFSKAGRNYAKAFSKTHGFDPYAAGGFVPNFASPAQGGGYAYEAFDAKGKATKGVLAPRVGLDRFKAYRILKEMGYYPTKIVKVEKKDKKGKDGKKKGGRRPGQRVEVHRAGGLKKAIKEAEEAFDKSKAGKEWARAARDRTIDVESLKKGGTGRPGDEKLINRAKQALTRFLRRTKHGKLVGTFKNVFEKAKKAKNVGEYLASAISIAGNAAGIFLETDDIQNIIDGKEPSKLTFRKAVSSTGSAALTAGVVSGAGSLVTGAGVGAAIAASGPAAAIAATGVGGYAVGKGIYQSNLLGAGTFMDTVGDIVYGESVIGKDEIDAFKLAAKERNRIRDEAMQAEAAKKKAAQEKAAQKATQDKAAQEAAQKAAQEAEHEKEQEEVRKIAQASRKKHKKNLAKNLTKAGYGNQLFVDDYLYPILEAKTSSWLNSYLISGKDNGGFVSQQINSVVERRIKLLNSLKGNKKLLKSLEMAQKDNIYEYYKSGTFKDVSKINEIIKQGYASGFIPSFAGGEALAKRTERRLTGSAIRSFDPRIGTYYRSAGQPANLDSLIRRDHPEGLSQAIRNSYATQTGSTPNFAPEDVSAMEDLRKAIEALNATVAGSNQSTQAQAVGDTVTSVDASNVVNAQLNIDSRQIEASVQEAVMNLKREIMTTLSNDPIIGRSILRNNPLT